VATETPNARNTDGAAISNAAAVRLILRSPAKAGVSKDGPDRPRNERSENLSPGFVIQTGVTMDGGVHARGDGMGMRG